MKKEGGATGVIVIDDIEDLISPIKPISPAAAAAASAAAVKGGGGGGGEGGGGGGGAAAAATAVSSLRETFKGHADAFHEVSEVRGGCRGGGRKECIDGKDGN